MSTLVLIIVLGLAVAQATRLWRDDSITEPIRDRLIGWLDPGRDPVGFGEALREKLVELLECPWCLSGWLALGAVVIADNFGQSIPLPGVVWFAVWRVAVLAYWLVEVIADADGELVEPTRRSLNVSLHGKLDKP